MQLSSVCANQDTVLIFLNFEIHKGIRGFYYSLFMTKSVACAHIRMLRAGVKAGQWTDKFAKRYAYVLIFQAIVQTSRNMSFQNQHTLNLP